MIVNQKIVDMSLGNIINNKLVTNFSFIDDIMTDSTDYISIPNLETNLNNNFILIANTTPFKIISTSNGEVAFKSSINFLNHDLDFLRTKEESLLLSQLLDKFKDELLNWDINNIEFELDGDIVITQYLANSPIADDYISSCNLKDVIINLIKNKNLKYECNYSIANNLLKFLFYVDSTPKKLFTTSSYIKSIELPNIDYSTNLVHYKYYYYIGNYDSYTTHFKEEFGYLKNDGTIEYGAAARSNAPANIKLDSRIELDTSYYESESALTISPSLQSKIETILLNSTKYEISFYDYKNEYSMGETIHLIHEGKKYITQVTGIEYNLNSKKITCGNNRIDLLFSIKKGMQNGTY